MSTNLLRLLLFFSYGAGEWFLALWRYEAYVRGRWFITCLCVVAEIELALPALGAWVHGSEAPMLVYAVGAGAAAGFMSWLKHRNQA